MISLKALKKICLVVAIEHALIVTSAHAATITVNNPDDTDGNDQACTLREAIQSIHVLDTASTGCVNSGNFFGIDDTVVFEPALTNLQIRLDQNSPLVIEKDLFINGLGSNQLAIDGTYNSPGGIFDIRGLTGEVRPNVRIDNLTISGGTKSAAGGAGFIVRNADLSLGNSIVSGNLVDFGGGGIHSSSATIHLNESTVSGNSTGSEGGGIFAYDSSIELIDSNITGNSSDASGGGIYLYESSIKLIHSSVSGNVARSTLGGGGGIANNKGAINSYESFLSTNAAVKDGGGIFSLGGTVRLFDSTMINNTAGDYGGGIAVRSGATLGMLASTVSGNTAQKIGGGIHSIVSIVSSSMSTISGNTANQGGGGIFFGANNPEPPLAILQTTIVNNFTSGDGGAIALVGDDARVYITNSIIAGNVAADTGAEFAKFGGTFDSAANNVLGDSSNSNAQAFAGFIPDPLGTDIIATSDGTMPTAITSILNTTLKNNGGPTKTHALVTNSPAIDAGSGYFCFSTDQRGIPRSDGLCDIGSFEFSPMIFSDSFE